MGHYGEVLIDVRHEGGTASKELTAGRCLEMRAARYPEQPVNALPYGLCLSGFRRLKLRDFACVESDMSAITRAIAFRRKGNA